MTLYDYVALKAGLNRKQSIAGEIGNITKKMGNILIERLTFLKLKPQRILDLGSGTSTFYKDLAELYPRAEIFSVDLAAARLNFAKGQAQAENAGQHNFIAADMHALPFQEESFDLIVSNLAWHWADPLVQAIAEAKRILKIGGALLFSTLGPDTLSELRASFAAGSQAPHIGIFLDLHDVGDALLKAGFADPVMDVEFMRHRFQSVRDLLKALRSSGETNYQTTRSRGMMGRKTLAQISAHYEQFRENELLPATTEVVFGYAWRQEEKSMQNQNEAGEITIPLSQLKRT